VTHDHLFLHHVGVRVFGGKGMAWVGLAHVTFIPSDALVMMRCSMCGEQGYAIPITDDGIYGEVGDE